MNIGKIKKLHRAFGGIREEKKKKQKIIAGVIAAVLVQRDHSDGASVSCLILEVKGL